MTEFTDSNKAIGTLAARCAGTQNKFVYIFRTDENPSGSCQPFSDNLGSLDGNIFLLELKQES